jgi:hypothetical protein
MKTLTAALTLCLASCLSAGAAENLAAETLLPAHGETCAYAPVAAFGKDVYLLVWQADRNEKADIVGLRLDKSGKPLDAKPLLICAAKDVQGGAFVTFGGGVFLVVWQDLRNEKDWDVYAARVTPEGKVLDPDGVLVAGGPLNQSAPAACFDGKGFLVLYANQLNERRIEKGSQHPLTNADVHVYGVRLSAEGRPDGTPVVAAKPPPGGWWFDRALGSPGIIKVGDGPALAAAVKAGRFMAFWNAAELKPPEKPVTANSGFFLSGPRLATDGKSALAVWSTFCVSPGRTSGSLDTGMLFIPEGDPTKVPADQLGGKGGKEPGRSLSGTPIHNRKQVRNPSPAWDGKSYVVAWDITMEKGFRYDAVLMRRVSAAGEPEGKDEPVAGEPESPAFRPAIASDGAGTTVIAYERHPKAGDQPIKIGVRILK